MVERQLAARGIADPRVLDAMREIPRHLFVPEESQRLAYSDQAVAIGFGQTISQPFVFASICEALELSGSELVLDVGSGSGYSTAVLSRLSSEVIGLEIVPELVERSTAELRSLGVRNAEIQHRDGSVGAPELAPFDAIAVHAAAPQAPGALLAQLAPGGRLVAPVRRGRTDYLTRYRLLDGEIEEAIMGPCRFVPLIGRDGVRATDDRPRSSRLRAR